MAPNDAIFQPRTSSPTEYVHDELIENNASLPGNHDDNLLFQNQLPEQLFQSDEKEGDSTDGPIRIGLNTNESDSPKPADGENTQENNQVHF